MILLSNKDAALCRVALQSTIETMREGVGAAQRQRWAAATVAEWQESIERMEKLLDKLEGSGGASRAVSQSQ